MKLLLIFIIGELIVHSTADPCRSALSSIAHPLTCCKYPKFFDAPLDTGYKCSALCKSLPSIPFRCLRNCFIVETGVIVKGTVNATAAEKLFFAQNDSEKLTDGWKKVLSESIKSCESSFPIKKGIRDEDYVYFYNKFIECVRLFNFVNCSEGKECTKVREDAGKFCGPANYDFLHEFFFEGTYERRLQSTMTTLSVATT